MTSRSSPATLPSGIASLLAACLLAGCASTLPTGSEDDESLSGQSASSKRLDLLPAEALRQRSLAVRTGSTPSFYADTPGRRFFGILGAIAMMREGNRLVEDYDLQDPAGQLSEDLLTALATRNNMRTSTHDAADLLLDVKTINWDFRPYRNDPEKLFVVYSARISLVDRRDGTVLASGKCRSRRDREGDSATLDQLLADGAKRLQMELREAAHECAQRTKDDTLSAFLPNAAPVAQQSPPARTSASVR
jgi:hypothetical protein